MDKQQWNMDDLDFDRLLEEGLPEEPPDSIAQAVTPWRRAMRRILWGLALNAVTFQFFGLQYWLPLAGVVLTLLGFRSLRQENRWFAGGWCLAWCQTVLRLAFLVVNATIWQEVFYELPAVQASGYLFYGMTVCQALCLWRGLRTVKAKAALPDGSSGGALLVWYLVLFPLAVVGYSGWILSILFLTAYGLILRSLWQISKALDEAGYAIRAARVVLSDRVLTGLLLVVLAVGMAAGYLVAGRYPMDWKPKESVMSEAAEEIKEGLLELGFPEAVLDDLTEEEVKACQGATLVLAQVNDYPVNNGRQVMEVLGDVQHFRTVYDQKELRIIDVAVRLPGERETWQLFHHFTWTIDPGFRGTESIQLWGADHKGAGIGWHAGAVTGRLLCDRDGQVYTAPYYSLRRESYTYDSMFWGTQTSTDIWATFSLPREGENSRGYLTYTVEELEEGWSIDSWVNYTHQQSFMQYPVRTAMGDRKLGGFSGNGAFKTIQDALQFYPYEEQPELYGN